MLKPMEFLVPIVIGFLAGYFAGQFGIGGGFLMQPALRLVVGAPALVSLGTPFPVIVVSAVTGAYNYYRSGYIDMRLAPYLAGFGISGAVLGSYATGFVAGDLLLLLTATALVFTSFRFIRGGEPGVRERSYPLAEERPAIIAALTGAFVGFFSGLLGLGGGFLLVPALSIIFKRDIKTAFGTSLLVIVAYAIPASIVHYALGHIDVFLMLLLSVGIIPGAYAGSRVAIGLPEALLRRLFGVFLFSVAVYFAGFELSVLVRG